MRNFHLIAIATKSRGANGPQPALLTAVAALKQQEMAGGSRKICFRSACPLAQFDGKGVVMKSFRVVSLFVGALVMGSVAQAQQTHVQATVPFNFLVGDKVYPAGDYTIQEAMKATSFLRIDHNGKPQAFALSHACSSLNPTEKTKLVFRRTGDSYSLYQIWTEGNYEGREFSIRKAEIQLASNPAKTDLVIVAANIVH